MLDRKDMREPTEAEVKAYVDLRPLITTGSSQERELGRVLFYAAGILTGAFLMGACWLVTSIG